MPEMVKYLDKWETIQHIALTQSILHARNAHISTVNNRFENPSF